MVLAGLSMDPMLDLDLDSHQWIELVLGPLRDIVRTLLTQGKPRQTQTCVWFLEWALAFTQLS